MLINCKMGQIDTSELKTMESFRCFNVRIFMISSDLSSSSPTASPTMNVDTKVVQVSVTLTHLPQIWLTKASSSLRPFFFAHGNDGMHHDAGL